MKKTISDSRFWIRHNRQRFFLHCISVVMSTKPRNWGVKTARSTAPQRVNFENEWWFPNLKWVFGEIFQNFALEIETTTPKITFTNLTPHRPLLLQLELSAVLTSSETHSAIHRHTKSPCSFLFVCSKLFQSSWLKIWNLALVQIFDFGWEGLYFVVEIFVDQKLSQEKSHAGLNDLLTRKRCPLLAIRPVEHSEHPMPGAHPPPPS